MATNTFNSIHHHESLRQQRRHPTGHQPPATTTKLFLKPTTSSTAVHLSLSTSSSATYSTPTTASPSTSQTISFDLLKHHLSSKNLRQADEETRRLIILLAGEAAVKRGYVFFTEVQFIPENDLKTIDGLWREHSENKFGYSVQKRIWKKMDKDFTRFFIKVGWMKKLENSEVEQYNYKSFPTEFMWEMEEGTPEGHLPLTNALRGTQLLKGLLNHPAFDENEDEDEDEDELASGKRDGDNGSTTNKASSKKIFKPNYTF